MKVVILPTSFPNVYNEISSIFVEDQALALSKINVDVRVVCAVPISIKEIIKKRKFTFGRFISTKSDLNVLLFLFPCFPRFAIFNEFIRFTINRLLLKEVYSNDKFDLIHVHNSSAGEAALWMKLNYNIPYVITEHSSCYARGLVKPWEFKRSMKIYLNASFRFAVSKNFCNILYDLFLLKFNYIPNVVDTNYFIPSANSKLSGFQFISIGRLDSNKNHSLLIHAFSLAFANDKSIKLIIVGDGSEYSNLNRLISNLHLEKQVYLMGFADRSMTLNFLNNSNCLVLSSNYETFGVVVIEAMSCGIPVIATKCGGPESIIIKKELGLIVSKNSIDELANAMVSLHNNRNNYSSLQIRDFIVSNFSENAVSYNLYKLYNTLLV